MKLAIAIIAALAILGVIANASVSQDDDPEEVATSPPSETNAGSTDAIEDQLLALIQGLSQEEQESLLRNLQAVADSPETIFSSTEDPEQIRRELDAYSAQWLSGLQRAELEIELLQLMESYEDVVIDRNRHQDKVDQFRHLYLELVRLYEETTGEACPNETVEMSDRSGVNYSYSILPVCQ